MPTYTRLAARRNNPVRLDVSFFRNGVLADPYAIRKVEIYKNQVLPHNLVAQIILPAPCDDTGYPAPVSRVTEDVPAGACGTDAIEGAPIPGRYEFIWDVPADMVVPDIYYDVWYYYPVNPCSLDEFNNPTNCGTDQDGCFEDPDNPAFADLLLSTCNRFWLYDDSWFISDNLQSLRFGFEPLDQRFQQPERRPLEIGITPLPLYDFNYNLNMPVIPFLNATITVETMNREVVVPAAAMEMGLRQGSYRTNPFVFRYMIDTADFYIGTYKYRVTVTLPDGSTRTSRDFILSIA